MPVTVRKRKCKDSQGNSGNFVVVEVSNGKRKSCHKTRANAEAAARIRNDAERERNRSLSEVKYKVKEVTDCCEDLLGKDE